MKKFETLDNTEWNYRQINLSEHRALSQKYDLVNFTASEMDEMEEFFDNSHFYSISFVEHNPFWVEIGYVSKFIRQKNSTKVSFRTFTTCCCIVLYTDHYDVRITRPTKFKIDKRQDDWFLIECDSSYAHLDGWWLCNELEGLKNFLEKKAY